MLKTSLARLKLKCQHSNAAEKRRQFMKFISYSEADTASSDLFSQVV